MFTKSESRDFMAVFPDLVRELTVEGPYAEVPVVSRDGLSPYQLEIVMRDRAHLMPAFSFLLFFSKPLPIISLIEK